MQTGSHQLSGPQAGLLLPVKFYMTGTLVSLPGSPVSQESEEYSSLIHEHHVLTFLKYKK